MWAKAGWSNRTKWIVTAVIVGLFLIGSRTPVQNSSTQTANTPVTNLQSSTQPTANTVSPTVDPAKQAVAQYGSQVYTLSAELLKQDQIIAQDTSGLQNNSVSIDKVRSDSLTAETVFKGIQEQLNSMKVPPEMTQAHSYFTTAVTLYIQGLDEVVKGIDDNDSSEITAGANTYSQGTDELTKATDAIKAYENSGN